MGALAGLFFSAFLAATLFPAASELLLASLAAGDAYSAWTLLAVASAGNILGSVVNWGLGRYCLHWRDRRWFPIKPDALNKATAWFNRYGVYSLLLSWVPVIGDPLTFAAGVLRTPFALFLLFVAIAKTGRYAIVLGLVDLIWL